MLENNWAPRVPPHQQPRYKPVKDFTFWPVLGSFNKWSIIKFSHKATFIEDIDRINNFVIDVISDNMYALAKTGKYVDINTTYTTTMGNCVIRLLSESYTLQEYITWDEKKVQLVKYLSEQST